MRRKVLTEEQKKEYRRVAFYYYKAGLTQEEIAKRMQMSRQRVNRMVSNCVELGIVNITIEGLDKCNLELEAGLERKYGLKEVRIISDLIEDNLMQELGIAGGRYLKSIIAEKDIVGLTRGRTTLSMVDHFPEEGDVPQGITIAQLIGSGKETEDHMEVDELVYRFAAKTSAKVSKLYAPVIVQSEEMRKSFTQEPFFKEGYEMLRKCTIAVVGIGTAHSQWKHMSSLYDVTDKRQTEWNKNVVGEVCTHFFDKEGHAVEPPFRNRIISIMLEDYKNIPTRIGIAGGSEKAEAIKAALKGNYINVLITDLKTAEQLIK